MGVNGGWGQMGLQDAPCRWWDAASGTEGSHGVVWGQLWGQRGRMGFNRGQWGQGDMGVSGGWGLQDPPLQAVGRSLGHWGGTGGQLWGQRGRVGSYGGNRRSYGVRRIRGSMGVGGRWGFRTPPPPQVGGCGLGH